MTEITGQAARETNGIPDGLIIDRSRITHKQSMDQSFDGAKIQKLNADLAAGKDVDFDELRRLVDRVDETLAQTVAALPSGWLPSGVTLATPGWIQQLPETYYDALTTAARPLAPGEKKEA